MTFEEYVGNVGKRMRRDRGAERLGQAYFNELSLTRPDIGDLVAGTYLDPFYVNDKSPVIGEFLTFVMVRW